MTVLADYLGPALSTGPDALFEAFVHWAGARGLQLYPSQEEALLAVLSGDHVVVGTPTGSGKSLVALGAHLATLAAGRRSWYTAPIKALVSEKFFDLCQQLGPERVGMLTGDASINPSAPVICCTAEVLANLSLRHGEETPADLVVMDEFHYYADPDRGWAWQVPLIELRGTQFVLMSATLGNVEHLVASLQRRTGRAVTVVSSLERPVPLDFRYSRALLHETIADILAEGLAPIYVVHFTQKAAVERAQALTSAPLTSRPERDAIARAIAGSRFGPGFGRVLSRLLHHGIGAHLAGMLPKYRRLVERLSQQGLLKVVCGTDTLGVGINLPIRTVLFTSLSKFDGSASRLLTAREFHQMAGRAGRAGYDPAGTVVVQAPEHVAENEKARSRAAEGSAKKRKLAKAKPPKGFVHWDEGTFRRLVASQPEPLPSSFKVSHSMLLNVLSRPGDGRVAMKRLLLDNDEDRPSQRRLARQAIAMYRSLLAAGVVEKLPQPDSEGRWVRVTSDLQEDFALNQPLSPFILDVLPRLDRDAPSWELDVVSVVASPLEDPWPVLAAQLDRLKKEVLARLKEQGLGYEERTEALRDLEHPKPLAELLYDCFASYRSRHAWARDYNVRPKSVLRDLYERAMSFSEYVAFYGVARSEGLLLRYLSDAYKALVQSVPEEAKSEALVDITEWLGEMVRQVDSSLLDEWEALRDPDKVHDALARGERPADGGPGSGAGADAGQPAAALTANARAFRVMVRNACFRRVELASRRDWDGLGDLDAGAGWDRRRWEAALAPYFASHEAIGTGPGARGPDLWQLEEAGRRWRVRQVLDDPLGDHDWALRLEVDLDASDAAGAPVLYPVGVGTIAS